jgi:hypothetical protein
MDRTEKEALNNSYIFLRIFVAAGTCSRLITTGRIHIQTHRLMGRIYEARHWDELRWHDIHTKFHRDRVRYSKVDIGDTYTDTQTARWSYKPTSIFIFRNKESRLKYNHAMNEVQTRNLLSNKDQIVTPLTCSWEVPSSNLCRDTDYHDWGFRGFCQYLKASTHSTTVLFHVFYNSSFIKHSIIWHYIVRNNECR